MARVSRDEAGSESEDAGDAIQGFDGGVAFGGFYLAQGLQADAAMAGEFGLSEAADLAHPPHGGCNVDVTVDKVVMEFVEQMTSLSRLGAGWVAGHDQFSRARDSAWFSML